MAEYIALIRKDDESDFCVDFPDFPGCISSGETLEEARRMAAEALHLHVQGMIEDGESIPEPSSLDVVMSDVANREAVAALIELKLMQPPARVVRINVSIPEDTLARIDAYAALRGTTRSAFLATAALLEIRRSYNPSDPTERMALLRARTTFVRPVAEHEDPEESEREHCAESEAEQKGR